MSHWNMPPGVSTNDIPGNEPDEARSVVLFSGGLDSTTLLYRELSRGSSVTALSFDYGQRHRKELAVAAQIVAALQDNGAPLEYHVIKLTADGLALGSVLAGSALTDSAVDVPEGHYADDSMKATVVPNRNAIMLSLAYGVAVAQGALWVMAAMHAGDHVIYPDCRPEFVAALDTALELGNRWSAEDITPMLQAPFVHMTKGQIALTAYDLKVPIEATWSCYKGGQVHCGRCGTCVERREAIEEARHLLAIVPPDPTQYEDRDYYKNLV
jgi:7-cyano-7-deazaguanine synthase